MSQIENILTAPSCRRLLHFLRVFQNRRVLKQGACAVRSHAKHGVCFLRRRPGPQQRRGAEQGKLSGVRGLLPSHFSLGCTWWLSSQNIAALALGSCEVVSTSCSGFRSNLSGTYFFSDLGRRVDCRLLRGTDLERGAGSCANFDSTGRLLGRWNCACA